MTVLRSSAVLIPLCLLATTWSWADEPVEVPTIDPPKEDFDLLCKPFERDLARPVPLDTRDRTSAIGQWVGKRRDEGWTLDRVDFEVGQKSTGFQQGWAYVCVRRPHGQD